MSESGTMRDELRKTSMSESRVVVPEGMLKAAKESEEEYLRDNQSRDVCREVILEASLRWLSENPMFPTHSEVNSILAMVQFQSLRGTSLDGLQDFAAMWQRRMFLAPPDPEVGQAAKRVMENMMGCTFTPTEADAILRELSFVAHGWRVPSTASCPACDNGQSLERGEGTHREGTRQHPVEPEVPEGIEDLLKDMAVGMDHGMSERIIEAYRRGQKEK
jgi:hypothetical protein